VKPTHIAHFGDTHLGYRKGRTINASTGRNLRAADFTRAFKQTVSAIIKQHELEPFDAVVHSGDVFDKPRAELIDLRAVISAVQRFKEAGIPQVWIAGNHDTSKMPQLESTFDFLANLLDDDATVIAGSRRQRELVTDTLIIYALPWGSWTTGSVDIPDPIRNSPYKAQIIVSHGDVRADDQHAIFTDDRGEEQTIPLDHFDYCAMGHLHNAPQRHSKIDYSGSTERSGWRDVDCVAQWLDVTLFTDVERVTTVARPLDVRPMHDLGTHSADDVAYVLSEQLPQIVDASKQDPLVRVAFECDDKSTGRDLTRQLTRDHQQALLQVDYWVTGSTRSLLTADVQSTTSLNVVELFEQYISEMSDEGKGFADRLRERGLAALHDAIESERELLAEGE
jgi:exonuclease SbcD